MKYTQHLAEWVASVKLEEIPAICIDKAKEQLQNIFGAMLMSVPAPANQGVVNAMRELDQDGPSTIVGTGYRVSPGSAAIANSFAAQLFEFEDWVHASHAGASVIPTALAVAEAVGASGKEFLTAIVIGNEMAGRTGRAMLQGANVGNSMPNHQIDTAFVAGRLMGLDVRALQSAVAFSCFMAMQPCPVGFLTDAKGLINSFPAYVGIAAAQMAKHGLVGNDDMIEHPAGYLYSVSEFVDLNQLVDRLGEDWVIPTLRSKPFPICGYNIAAIEAALQIVRAHDINVDEVAGVEVFAPGSTLYAGTRFHSLEPSVYQQIESGTATHMPLLFDVPYPMAAAMIDRELTPRQYDEAHIADPRIRSLAEKIKLKVDPDIHDAYYKEFKFGSRVVVSMIDGSRFESMVEEMPGAPSNPFDVGAKFMAGAEPLLGRDQAEEALSLILSLPEVDDVSQLANLLRVRP